MSQPAEVPDWVARHGLSVGGLYVTADSDLVVEYLGLAQVRDDHGFRLVMVFRETDQAVMLTLNEVDADASAGFVPLGDDLENRFRGPD